MSPLECAQADVAFLLARAMEAGSCGFTADRWVGASSNAIVAVAYGVGEQDEMPSDRGDYAACVRTVHRLPRHRCTPAVMEALRLAREAYLKNYPRDRFPAERRKHQAEREEAHRQWIKKRNRYPRRRA